MAEMMPLNTEKARLDTEENKPVDEKEQIIQAIGGWGPWQLRRCILIIIIIWLPASFHLLNMVYYTAPTDYWCKRPVGGNFTIEQWKLLTHKQLGFENKHILFDPCWVKQPLQVI
ncbi:uncharacterized protein LOC111710959 [Eurytemora carolleeae]|uniref:uncharacterized protein LOC111710959 n=1 Tax=Eurytemora carolleeae TaxID=1294199 RepID=UPI000C78518F|nr:uncharacterized protein LOC111710959 [Eurytemora carolleeae]|eukprot:XP_023340936.1 uncharacterized protein LOC111710959 [Eurytemora affinis]